MVSKELMDLLAGVLSSWEVVAVTLALVAYFFLVFYVARLYRKPRSLSMGFKPKAAKPAKAAKAAPEASGDEDPEIED